MANLIHGGDRKSDEIKSSMEPLKPAVSIERAAKLAGTSPANIKRAKPIVQTGIPHPVRVRVMRRRHHTATRLQQARPQARAGLNGWLGGIGHRLGTLANL
jgi:hypothetical protein